ncbi:MAG: thioredoxin domain-containing protein [Candidatus Gracilibacteria bacterium]
MKDHNSHHVDEDTIDTSSTSECSSSNCCSQGSVSKCSHIGTEVTIPVMATIALATLIMSFAIPAMTQYYMQKNETDRRAYDMQKEYAQVGGQENYEAILKYRADETSKQVALLKQSQTGSPLADDTGTVAQASTTFSKEDIAAMIKDQVIHGPANADILMIEYTDPECPYCQRQYQYGSIDQALKMEGVGTIAHIIKPVTGVGHPNTVQKGIALICAGKVGGYESLAKLEKTLFNDQKISLDMALKNSGVDIAKIQTCIKGSAASLQFSQNDAEFAKVTANTQGAGTPTTLIINTKTGKSDFILGSLPAATFQEKIKALAK